MIDQTLIKETVDYLEKKTCLSFIESKNEYTLYNKYLRFKRSNFCGIKYEPAGTLTSPYLTKPVEIYVGPNCRSYFIIGHLMMHGLGFHHEMNRKDRDS
ncbi:blastula protease 10-like protein [Dinothrombium tinctorium]|uniref:Metalloendopeptidase n=1 Tax=Dinothrombium tinctorium TaxID=1965070 RepID=A0A3S3RFL8_9ACAR|nr:blastula protease 10-like protein [Dinothrombium tinctorium]